MSVEDLAKKLAYDKCFDAEIEGYGFNTEKPEDIERFMDSARKDAQEHAEILGYTDYTIEDMGRLEKVLSLHFPVIEDGEPVGCQCCDWDYGDNWSWPCETFRAAGGVA